MAEVGGDDEQIAGVVKVLRQELAVPRLAAQEHSVMLRYMSTQEASWQYSVSAAIMSKQASTAHGQLPAYDTDEGAESVPDLSTLRAPTKIGTSFAELPLRV